MCYITKSSNYQIDKVSNYQIIKLLNCSSVSVYHHQPVLTLQRFINRQIRFLSCCGLGCGAAVRPGKSQICGWTEGKIKSMMSIGVYIIWHVMPWWLNWWWRRWCCGQHIPTKRLTKRSTRKRIRIPVRMSNIQKAAVLRRQKVLWLLCYGNSMVVSRRPKKGRTKRDSSIYRVKSRDAFPKW